MGIRECIALLLAENASQVEHVFDGQRWDVRLDQRETVHVLVSFLLGENGWLVEPTETVDELLESRLVALAVTSVLCLAKLF